MSVDLTDRDFAASEAQRIADSILDGDQRDWREAGYMTAADAVDALVDASEPPMIRRMACDLVLQAWGRLGLTGAPSAGAEDMDRHR